MVWYCYWYGFCVGLLCLLFEVGEFGILGVVWGGDYCLWFGWGDWYCDCVEVVVWFVIVVGCGDYCVGYVVGFVVDESWFLCVGSVCDCVVDGDFCLFCGVDCDGCFVSDGGVGWVYFVCLGGDWFVCVVYCDWYYWCYGDVV